MHVTVKVRVRGVINKDACTENMFKPRQQKKKNIPTKLNMLSQDSLTVATTLLHRNDVETALNDISFCNVIVAGTIFMNALSRSSRQESPRVDISKYLLTYSRTSLSRTWLARLPWLFRTRSCVTYKKYYSCRPLLYLGYLA